MNGFLLHLNGPMMSFADTGFGQIRDTGLFPSRSAVLGVVAAALGIERGSPELRDLHAGTKVHVGAYRTGSTLVDYHTVLTAGYDEYDPARLRREGLAGANPVLTWRSFMTDAHFVALVETTSSDESSRLSKSLHRPVFVSYLGRRSCPPALPLLPIALRGNSICDALAEELLRPSTPVPIRHDAKQSDFDAWLDGDMNDSHLSDHTVLRPTILSRGFRRDLMTEPPRSYRNRPFTHIRLKGPDATGSTDTSLPSPSNEELFHAAP